MSGAGFGGRLSGERCISPLLKADAKPKSFTPDFRYLPTAVALAPLLTEEASEKRCQERLFKKLLSSWRARAGIMHLPDGDLSIPA